MSNDKYTAAVDEIIHLSHHMTGDEFEYGWDLPSNHGYNWRGGGEDDKMDLTISLPPVNFTKSDPKLDQWFKDVGAHVEFKGFGPRWSRPVDTIFFPQWKNFIKPEFYYTGLAHEHIHWTGAEIRLNRPQPSADFSNDENHRIYQREEIVAELGSMFWEIQMGTPVQWKQHAAYLASWGHKMGDELDFMFGNGQHSVPMSWVRETGAPRAIKALAYLNQRVAQTRSLVAR